MNERFLLVSADALPDYFEKVITARELIEKSGLTASAACQSVGLNRSTFYKYKNKVFPSETTHGKKSILWLKMADVKGVLSHILSAVYDFNLNVIAVNQTLPVKNYVYVTITTDVSDLKGEIHDLVKTLRQIENVKSVSLVAFE